MRLLKHLALRFLSLTATALFIPALQVQLPLQTPTPLAPEPALGTAVYSDLPFLSPQYVGCGGQTAPIINPQYEQRIFELVNDERLAAGLPPLKRVNELDIAARYHSADMQQDNYYPNIYHDTYDRVAGTLQFICNWDTRLSSYYTEWSTIGENIAAGYTSPESVMNGWMNSAGHSANILSSSFWEIGVGYSEGGGNYYRYYTQDFGRRNGVYPLVINQDDLSTDQQTVSLYIYGTTTYGNWTQMRLRNNSDPWSAWQPFSNNLTWQLPPWSGDHTVSVELTRSGASASSSDTIHLDLPTPPVLGNLPEEIFFTYSIPDQLLWPLAVELTPLNTGTGATINWSLNANQAWLGVDPTSGATPNSFTITPDGFNTHTVTTLEGTVTVTATSPPGVNGSPKSIAVHLNIIGSNIWRSYLPVLVNPNP